MPRFYVKRFISVFLSPTATYKDRTTEHPQQSEHRAQQRMFDKHLQVQIRPCHQWSDQHTQKCEQHGKTTSLTLNVVLLDLKAQCNICDCTFLIRRGFSAKRRRRTSTSPS